MFLSIFCVEAVLKILGEGPREYWGQNWNRFDFAVVSVSVVWSIIEVRVLAYSFLCLLVHLFFRRVRERLVLQSGSSQYTGDILC